MAEVIVINQTIRTDTQKLRVCAYCRVSSDSADQQNSFIAQVTHYTDYITANPNWDYVDTYADEGLTGLRADKREEFQRMLRDCRRGRIDRILVKSLSRFSRNTSDAITTIRELKSMGISVSFEENNIDTAQMNSEMMVAVFSSMAQEESVSISSNQRWSYQRRMKKGDFITCSEPFGYRLKGRELVVDDMQAKIVRQIFNEYLHGKSTRAIATVLNDKGITNKAERAWGSTSILYLLQNEKYIGDALLQKSYTTDTLPFSQVLNKGEKDKYYIENSHPAIISREEYAQTGRLLKKRNSSPDRKPAAEYPLTKKLICGDCGKTFKRKEISGTVYWTCYSHNEDKDRCPIRQLPEQVIYAALIHMYNKLKTHMGKILYPILSELHDLQAKSYKGNHKIGETNKEIAELTEQNYMLSGLRSKGYMDSAIFMEQSVLLNKRISELRDMRRKLLNDEDENRLLDDTKALIDMLEEYPDGIDSFNSEIFAAIISGIIVKSQDTLIFRLSNGLELNEPITRG